MKAVFLFPMIILFSCHKQNEKLKEHLKTNASDSTIIYKSEAVEIIYRCNDVVYKENHFNYQQLLTKQIDYDTINGGFYYSYFYDNGILAESGKQGEFNGCGVEIGPVRRYDETGNLLSEEQYRYAMPDNEEGCHSMEIVRIVSEYQNGQLLSVKTYCSSYESEEQLCFE